MRQTAAQGMYPIHGKGNKAGGIRIPPLRLAGGEMPANVAVANGTQYGVGNRVQGHIGVTMARQLGGMGNINAAQADPGAGLEPVHIEALSDAHIE